MNIRTNSSKTKSSSAQSTRKISHKIALFICCVSFATFGCSGEQAADKPRSLPASESPAPATSTQQSDSTSTNSDESTVQQTPGPKSETKNTESVSVNSGQSTPEQMTASGESDSTVSGNVDQTNQTSAPTTSQGEGTSTDSSEAMLALAKKSGCLACHSVDKKIIGPAWKDVAKRYAADSQAKAKLVEKVKKGGRGNWKEVVGNNAMPPYFPRVTEENINKLVDFILALDTSS